jgi:hypothetical protein
MRCMQFRTCVFHGCCTYGASNQARSHAPHAHMSRGMHACAFNASARRGGIPLCDHVHGSNHAHHSPEYQNKDNPWPAYSRQHQTELSAPCTMAHRLEACHDANTAHSIRPRTGSLTAGLATQFLILNPKPQTTIPQQGIRLCGTEPQARRPPARAFGQDQDHHPLEPALQDHHAKRSLFQQSNFYALPPATAFSLPLPLPLEASLSSRAPWTRP